MIALDDVAVWYSEDAPPVLRDVNLDIDEGELALVVGVTGVGKSTLLGLFNGLVPHFTGGRLHGRVTVGDYDTRVHPPREMADVVGRVGQDPLAGFVTDTVEEELAYGMEQLAVPASVMRKRVEEVLDLMGIAELRDRPLHTLSGGQQQRVAIGGALSAAPRVLILDEPTSALDPGAAEDVIAVVTRLVHDLGTTVVMAEHRMERVLQYADRLVLLSGEGRVRAGSPAMLIGASPVMPPVARLGRELRWEPLPLSVRDARRKAAPIREMLSAQAAPRVRRVAHDGPNTVTARKVTVSYGALVAVRDVDLSLRPGSVTALMGRNGSGKSSLLWTLQGSLRRRSGQIEVLGADPAQLSADTARRLISLVPQSATDLLYLESVAAECAAADNAADATPGACRETLERLVPGIPAGSHPRDLSEGQRLAVALAVQLTADPTVLLLDEPTRGLDYLAKEQLVGALDALAAEGRSVLVATHDVEFVAQVADRVLVMAQGEVIADGPTAEVVSSSPIFAPQIAKVLAPMPWLTVEQVRASVARGDTR